MMGLKAGDVVKSGISRLTATNGLMFTGLFFIVGLLGVIVLNSFLAATGRMLDDPAVSHHVIQQIGATVPAPVIGVLWAGLIVVGAAMNIAALRTFVSDETDVIPTAHFQRNIGFAVANMIAGGLLFLAAIILTVGAGGLLLAMGFIIAWPTFGLVGVPFIALGVFLTVSLWFFDVYIAVDDQNFYNALRASWRTTAGNRFSLFLIGVSVMMLSTVIDAAFIPVHAVVSVESALQPAGLQSELVSALPSAIGLVLMHTITAQAYNALNALESDG